MRITLTITEGPHAGKVFTFAEHDNFVVGRSQRAHFRLVDDKYFSRFHFMVEMNPPSCRLADLNSHNGTWLNGTRVTTPADVQDGDLIKAGHTVLRVGVEVDVLGGRELSPELLDETVEAPSVDGSDLDAPVRVTSARARGGNCPACDAKRLPGEWLCAQCGKKAAQQAQPIPGYRLVRRLGQGAMGVVYLGVREADGLAVAVKTIIPGQAGTPAQVARFLREASILQQLDHPNIVAFREMGLAQGKLFFAMDYVHGMDAARYLKKRGPLPIPRGVRLICQLLRGVMHAHERGIVHRDIKPANVLIERSEGKKNAWLADFGLARVYQASALSGLTLTGDVGGTPAFMPPEQITNYREAKPHSDQYAVAAMLYNLLTGHYLYDTPKLAVQQLFALILNEEPVPLQQRLPTVPARLAAIVHRALAKDPADRHPSAAAFREALLAFA